MLQRPAIRRVRDQQNARAVELGKEVVQEGPSALDDLAVALAARVRLVDARRLEGVDLGDRGPIQVAVVALAEPPVLVNRNVRARECDLTRLDRTTEAGREDG